jgi:hypothetical protein
LLNPVFDSIWKKKSRLLVRLEQQKKVHNLS